MNEERLPAHLAAGNAWSVIGLAATEALGAAIVDEIACGLVVADADGTIRFANRAADEELREAQVLRRSGDVIRCTGLGAHALGEAMRAAAAKRLRQIVLVGSGAYRLMVSVVPLQLRADTGPLVLLVLGRRRPCSPLGLEMLAKLYGLTLAERRVMAALMEETAPREIAAANGVAISTVRTQISSIREKLGTRSIDGLLIRAAEVPDVTGALRFGGLAQRGAAAGIAHNERPCELPIAA